MFKTSRKYWLVIIVAIALMAVSVERSFATQLTLEDFSTGTTGWTGTASWGVWDPTSVAFNSEPDGNVAYLNSGSISQYVSPSVHGSLASLNEDHLYTLSVDVGYQKNCVTCKSFGYTIELWAGGPTPFLSESGTGEAGKWKTVKIEQVAPSNGGPLEIRLSTSGKRTHFDNVSLTNSVPEPATLLLLGSGLMGLALFGKKKFKA